LFIQRPPLNERGYQTQIGMIVKKTNSVDRQKRLGSSRTRGDTDPHMAGDDNVSFFLKLFARGRYVTSRSIAQKEASAKDPQHDHEERERFAVAAIAFCIKRDSSFRRHFLKVVADSENADVYEVDVEPKRWGDLVLKGKDVVVLEFKLQALLAEHQDPSTSRFASSGYGREIRDAYGDRRKVVYIVVGKDVSSGRTKNNIPYRGLPWSAFLVKDRKEVPIERDLFDCLAILGVPIFLTRHMKKKNVTTEAIGAMEVYQLLNAVAEGIRSVVDSGIDYIGLELRTTGAASMSLHKSLNDVVAPEHRALGWIGYEKVDEHIYLSVWFYSSGGGRKTVRKRLGLLEATGRGDIIEDEPSEGTSVGFKRLAVDESDHKAWLEDVLKTVCGKE